MQLTSSIFIGGTELAVPLLRKLVEQDSSLKAVFYPSSSSSRNNSDYANMSKISAHIPSFEYGKINHPETLKAIQNHKPDIIYAFGISELLSKELLSIPLIGTLGGHISLLPQNRGRHPIIWSIANGLKESAVSVIWLDEGADTGDLAAQKRFTIDEHENAGDIYRKVQNIYVALLTQELLPKFQSGLFPRRPQSHEPGNVWRKRNHLDGVIDWRMSATRIHNLVRALHPPYPCASFFRKDEEYKVTKTLVCDAPENLEPGKILAVNERQILVKAGYGAIWLQEHTMPPASITPGQYL